MSRAVLVLSSPPIRAKALDWIKRSPDWTRLTFQGPKRTLPQNDRMWAMLTDVATQVEHMGKRCPAEDWKVLFLHALGRETRFIPALDGHGFVPIGQSSSDLSVEEMTELIEFIFAWGAEHGVEFHEPENPAEKRAREAGDAA
jgi:hypothetical protein